MTSADDAERFLRELRQLRDAAGLGHAELAARAHYPYDSIKAAEVGPALPDLPVLSAFVRGCGGTTEEWEERWRSLTRTPSLPVSDARDAGNSAAAVAGARIGSVTQGADNPDPSIIMAALNRVAEGMASGSDDVLAALPDTSASWADSPSGDSAAFPADAQADILAGSQPGAAAASPADAHAAHDAFQPDNLAASQPDTPAAFAADAAFPADTQAFPGDAPAFAQADYQPDELAGAGADAQADPFAAWAVADKPAADGGAAGWDPIRMSTAWPALPDSPIDAALTAEVPPWETAPWAEDPSAAAAPGATAASAGRAKSHAAAGARSRGGTANRAGAPRSAVSKIWLVAVAVVLLCVIAVVLAIFA